MIKIKFYSCLICGVCVWWWGVVAEYRVCVGRFCGGCEYGSVYHCGAFPAVVHECSKAPLLSAAAATGGGSCVPLVVGGPHLPISPHHPHQPTNHLAISPPPKLHTHPHTRAPLDWMGSQTSCAGPHSPAVQSTIIVLSASTRGSQLECSQLNLEAQSPPYPMAYDL